jgi:hypothetical protein
MRYYRVELDQRLEESLPFSRILKMSFRNSTTKKIVDAAAIAITQSTNVKA